MHSVLFIAHGAESSAIAEPILLRENVVVTRIACADDAAALVAAEPFDAVVCAIDDYSDSAAGCISLAGATPDTPCTIVVRDWDVPVRSVEITTRVVVIQDGAEAVRNAIRQQLRRVRTGREYGHVAPAVSEFSFAFPAHTDRIARARAVVGGFVQRCLAIEPAELIRLEMVIEEALRNAVCHGSTSANPECVSIDGNSEPQVLVSLLIDDDNVRVTVEDEGPGFDVQSTAGASDREAVFRTAGRGLMMMKAWADHVEFNETGNAVTLTRRRQSIESHPNARHYDARAVSSQVAERK